MTLPLKYDVTFGHRSLDLAHIERPARPTTIELSVRFGTATLLVDPSWPQVIERMPAFGVADRYVTTDAAEPLLTVRVHTLFGVCEVKEVGNS